MNILQPLENLIISLLTFFHNITDQYGISLILLSLSMTIIMFPLFLIAERIQKKDELKKAGFQADLKKLNDVNNSQEKYFYTRRLYKIHNYHPISSLKSLIGLFIQIPFFMAAYRSLSVFEDFTNISFLFINDLSQPDGLLFGLNILPVVMTLINLISSFLYAKDKNRSEKIQLVFIALIFLFLLYDMPAAMLIYWTFNNFFAIFKNALLDKDIFYREIHLRKPLDIAADRLFKGKTLDGLRMKFIVIQLIFAAVVFLSFYLSDPSNYKLVNQHMGLGFSIMKYLFVCYALFLLYIHLLFYKEKKFNIVYMTTFAFFVLSYLTVDNMIKNRNFFVISYLLFNISLFFSYYAYKIDELMNMVIPEVVTGRRLSSKMLILLSGMIIVLNPTVVYNSSPVDFSYSYMRYILILMLIFAVISFIVYKIVHTLNKGVLNYLFLFSVIILFSAILNQYLFSGDYGVLDNFTFKDNSRLYPDNRFLISGASILIAFGIALFFIKNRCRFLNQTLNFLSLFFILITLYSFYTKPDVKRVEDIVDSSRTEMEKISFSKTDPNVVVLYMDRFSAGLISYALEEYPVLLTRLDGFEYFSSVFSNGSSTLFGAPAALGGSEYTVEENNRRDDLSNKEKISQSFSIIPYLMKHDAGFNVNVYGLPFFDRILLKDNMMDQFSYNLKSPLKKKWLADQANAYYSVGDDLNLQGEISNLLAISLFKNSLPGLRGDIYNKGNWLSKHGKILPSIGEYAVLDYLPEISYIDFDDSGNGHYNWIESDFVHRPGGIGYDLIPTKDPQIKQKDLIRFNNNKETVYSYYNVVVFLQKMADWVDWMKDNDVYDNTRIVIPSDHGFGYAVNYYLDGSEMPKDIDRRIANYFHTALLCKDFGSRGEMVINSELLSNSEFVSMTLDGIVENPINPYTGNEIKSLNAADGLTMHYTLDWDLKMNPDNLLRYNQKLRVEGKNINNLKWEVVE